MTLHKDGETITVTDNGRGIPVDMHPKHKRPALELILTTLHAGGKFENRNYYHAGGLHGVGASVVTALSVVDDRRASSATASTGSSRSRAACRRASSRRSGRRAAPARRSPSRADREIFPQARSSSPT